MRRITRVMWCVLLLIVAGARPAVPPAAVAAPAAQASGLVFAVIGDYGREGHSLESVANLIKSWDPAFVLTTGDNNYPDGGASTMDANIGQYFHDYIQPYTGAYGAGADLNRFFPTLGNHDYYTPGAQPYFDYFALPGNERYYELVWGAVHLFALNSNPEEPDGITAGSAQAQWLQSRLAASTAPWKIVYLHHPPYSSGNEHGSTPALQWPFAAWGATAVIAGHDHTYERIERNGILYLVNGLGGRNLQGFGAPVEGSQARYNNDYGALRVSVNCGQLLFQFFRRNGELIDSAGRGVPCAVDYDHFMFLPVISGRGWVHYEGTKVLRSDSKSSCLRALVAKALG